MTNDLMALDVFGGVDTHSRTHHVAVVDGLGRELGDREFPATPAGYDALHSWLVGFGQLVLVGVEGTGSYGAGLMRTLTRAGTKLVEVDRPDRTARRAQGKSDPLDAYAAARAAASGRAAGTPKSRDGIVESIRCLRLAQRSAIKARTQCINQIRALLVNGPIDLREQMRPLSTSQMLKRLSHLRPTADFTRPDSACRLALRSLARRHGDLDREIKELHHVIADLTEQAAPELLERPGVGVQVAAQLLITAGDNPDRLGSEASFAHLAGVAPVPASSGKRQNRHRLNRGGDRAANNALYTVALVRMRYHEPTRAYVQRRTAEGLSKKDIIRCLKRAIAREMFRVLTTPSKPITQSAPPVLLAA
ncbi:IS110 family transposase [Arthrobacter echini]|uniref:IS110 family transposase n=1 Tax=Arthrobacter echini TaxID=1529066 RepID=A0A5D0XKT1_9MICC|nr:IS110 family transposase [Arthrobacter echini]TYC96829.1 IS110 family transposase [Arthrobacter echini]